MEAVDVAVGRVRASVGLQEPEAVAWAEVVPEARDRGGEVDLDTADSQVARSIYPVDPSSPTMILGRQASP